jgi:hypothetical protein
MISSILELERKQQLELLALLVPRVPSVNRLTGQELEAELVRALRNALDVPTAGDLPEYARRRLIELARDDFELAPSFDNQSSLHVAELLVTHVVSAAATLTEDPGQRREFSRFLRTKDVDERYGWLLESEILAGYLSDAPLEFAAASERAHARAQGPEAYLVTATQVVQALARIRREPDWKSKLSLTISQRESGPVVFARQVGLVGVALFMAGAKGFGRPGNTTASDALERRKRARRSRLVQRLISVCAFVVACSGALEIPNHPGSTSR